MFELYQLRYFLAVVETGSFTKAAKRVRVSQPTLSTGIQKLERALDAALFDRSRRRIFLTEAGTRLVEHARSIVAQCQAAGQAMTNARAPDVLRLGVLMTIPTKIVARLVRDFRRLCAGCVVELFEGTEQEVHNRLEDGQFDLSLTVLRTGHHERAVPLYKEGYSLAVSAQHPLAQRPHAEVGELRDEPVIVRTRCEVLSESSRFFTDHNVRPRLVYRTDQDERALAWVGAGLGVTVMPNHYRNREVARIPLLGFEPERQVGLVHAPGPAPTRGDAATRFAEFALDQSWSSGSSDSCHITT